MALPWSRPVNTKPLIEINNVWKIYADQVVLEGLRLRINAGEFCVVVGASGCGKTTFLRMLLGEDPPSRGQLLLDGNPLPSEPGPERGIVFQRYSVFPHLSVLGNVMLGLEFQASPLLARLRGRARREATTLALALLDQVGLATACHRYPAELSGGMQQRLALAQSLITKPRILLLDEPFGALDPGIRADMHVLVKQLWREHGLTIVMVTHDLKEGFALATRLMVFDKVRHDAQAPHAYGARVTYDLPLNRNVPLADSKHLLNAASQSAATAMKAH
jgi:NitT/TauT family transport system ATP-binding protein